MDTATRLHNAAAAIRAVASRAACRAFRQQRHRDRHQPWARFLRPIRDDFGDVALLASKARRHQRAHEMFTPPILLGSISRRVTNRLSLRRRRLATGQYRQSRILICKRHHLLLHARACGRSIPARARARRRGYQAKRARPLLTGSQQCQRHEFWPPSRCLYYFFRCFFISFSTLI